jgi:hypothetical protein
MMKRYFYCLSALFLVVTTFPTYAQIGSGPLLIEGNFGARRNSQNFNGSSGPGFVSQIQAVNINPVGGIFLKDNLVLGVSGTYQNQTYRSEHTMYEPSTTHDFVNREISIAPFVRKYIFLNDNLAISGEIQAGFGRWKSNSTQKNHYNPTYETVYLGNYSANGVFASFRPGLSYFFTPWFATRASLDVFRYDLTKQKEQTSNISRLGQGGQFHEHVSTGSSATTVHRTHFGFSLYQFDLGASFFLGR